MISNYFETEFGDKIQMLPEIEQNLYPNLLKGREYFEEQFSQSFPNLFKSLQEDISSKKYDFIFVHTLVPHRPYGFNKKCHYDGSLSLNNRYFSVPKMVKQHNIERKCTFFYLDIFLEELTKNNSINSINLTILSDHGSRIQRTKDSDLPSIFAFRNNTTSYKEIEEKKILHNLKKKMKI